MINSTSQRWITLFLISVICGFVSVCGQAGLGVSQSHTQPGPSKGDRFEGLLRQGFELHRQGRYAQSIPLLQQAYALRPGDHLVNLLLGIDNLRSGETIKALKFLSNAREIRPADSTALGYLAEAFARLQTFDRAAETLQLMASSASNSSQEPLLSLVKFYLERFRLITDQLLSTTRGAAYFYRLQALALHTTRDPKERDALLRVHRLAPDFPGLHGVVGHEYLSRSQFQQAKVEFSKALGANPNDLDAMVGEAVLAVSFGDFQKAKNCLSEVASRSPYRLTVAFREWPAAVALPADLTRPVMQPSVPSGAKTALTSRQQFEEQRWESLVATISSKTKSTEESLWRGIGLSRLERYEEAISPLEAARQGSQLRLEANYWLALCYARGVERRVQSIKENASRWLVHVVQGELLLRISLDGLAAASEYRKAVAIVPGDPALWDGLAAAQLLAGDSEEACRSAGQALRLDPQRRSASRILAEAYIKAREYERAIAPLRQLLESQPEDVGAQVLLGTAYAKTGQDSQARRLLEAALREGYPDEKGAIHYLLGTVLHRLGHEQEAENAFERSRALSDAFTQTSHGRSQDNQQPR